MSLDELRAKLDAQEAYLKNAQGNAEGALALLSGKRDPEAVSRALDILLEHDRFADAVVWVKDLALDALWADRIVIAYLRTNDDTKAEQVLEWSRSSGDPTVHDRCALSFARTLFSRDIGMGSPLLPGELDASKANTAKRVLVALNPILYQINARNRIDTGIQANAVQVAHQVCWLLQDSSEARKLAKYLETYDPLPLAVARIHLQSPNAESHGLAQRIRDAHPQSFDAQLLASLLQSEVEGTVLEAFSSAKSLVTLADTDERREDLCVALADIAQSLGVERLREVQTITSAVLPPTHRFQKVMAARMLLETGAFSEAKSILDQIADRSDSLWLQLQAHYLAAVGDKRHAADELQLASNVLPHPKVLESAAKMSAAIGRLRNAIRAAKRIVAQRPDSADARRLLTYLLVEADAFDEAAVEFEALIRLEPNQQSHRLNYAACLVHSGQFNAALQEYEALCNVTAPELKPILMRAHLLKMMGQPDNAVATLKAVRDRFWEDWQFVAAVMHLGYSGNADRFASEAFQQLAKLKNEGKAPSDILQAMSLDDLKTRIRKWNETQKSLWADLVRGKFPWMFVDRLLRAPSYRAWSDRTQPLRWFSEDVDTRGQFGIYASHGFYAIKDANGSGTLGEVECPAHIGPLVVDYTALITLHRLGILEVAVRSVENVVIPNLYLLAELKEHEELQNHQPSRLNELVDILAAVEKSLIGVEAEETLRKEGLPYVHEHTTDDEPADSLYRLRDVLELLGKCGLEPSDALQQLQAAARQPSASSRGLVGLQEHDRMFVDESTLRTIAHFGFLNYFLSKTRAFLSSEDIEQMQGELRAYRAQEQMARGHDELWQWVRQSAAVKKAVVEMPEEWNESADRDHGFIAAAVLAEQEKHPLLIDDRVLQNYYLLKTDSPGAFGTAQFIEWLAAKGAIDANQAVDSLMKLIRWRFRFIILRAERIKAIVDRGNKKEPGGDLLALAEYIHDCLNDPGLFAGVEPTDPPMSMALRFFQTWTSAIAECVISIWADPNYEAKQAHDMTIWIVRHLLPSPPRAAGLGGVAPGLLTARFVLGRAMIAACMMTDASRAGEALRTLAEGLGLSENEYLRISTEVIHAV